MNNKMLIFHRYASFLPLIAGWVFCIVWRLMPFRPPNVEPVLALTMPTARLRGPVAGFIFPAVSMVLFDLLTGVVGSWTWVGAVSYGLVGLGAWYFLQRKQGIVGYLLYAVIGTVVFDLLTGVLIGPLFIGQSITEAFIGQIPFTVNHLIGNIVLAAALTPLWVVFDRWLSSRILRGLKHA